MVKLQNTGIGFTAILARMSQKILVNIFPRSFTGRFCSFLYLLQVSFFGIPLVVGFIERMRTVPTGLVTYS